MAKAVYLGNWMANAQRTGQEGDPRLEEYEEITEYIFSLAPEFGFSKTLEHELECGDHTETTEVVRIHQEYDGETFWEELCDMLGERDFYRKYSQEERKKMSDEEHYVKLLECIIAYEDEAEECGIDRLEISRQTNYSA